MCITEETALQICLDRKSVNADTMMHVYACPKCQKLLKYTAEDILDDYLEPVLREDKWTEFINFFNEHLQMLKTIAARSDETPNQFGVLGNLILSSSAVLLPGLFAGLLPSALTGSNEEEPDKQPADGKADIFCRLIFEADTNKDRDEYWNAQLFIPDDFSDEAPIVFVFTRNNGSNINEGTLNFSHLQLPIKDGLANATLGDFRKALKEPQIRVSFLNHKDVQGNLVFFE